MDPIRIEDLSAAQIKAVLAAEGDDLSDEQALAIQEFILRAGGIANARLAVEMLSEIERAA